MVSRIVFSQNNLGYPLDKLHLTGKYGELRPNHFHAGLDFSTRGQINLPVYVVDQGYVSRIKVGPYGYGKVVYVTHPGGIVTVYAHQNKFHDKINNYVKQQQYIRQSFEVELFPSEKELVFKKGEIIGYSGNTGSSTGPHLHFEVRDAVTEIPLNPLLYLKLPDDIKPTVNSIALYDLSDYLNPKIISLSGVVLKQDSLVCLKDSLELPSSIIGIAFSGEDKGKNGSTYNIYEVKLVLDNKLIYHHRLNYISFDNARYVNEFSEKLNGQKFQKCFTPKAYPVEMYKSLVNNGRIELKDKNFHQLRMEFIDEAGNFSELKFYLKSKMSQSYKTYPKTELFINCLEAYTFKSGDFEFSLPAKAIFNDAILKISGDFEKSNNVTVEPENTSFRFAGTMKVKLPQVHKLKGDKLLLKNNGSYLTPIKCGEYNEYEFKNFGKFKLVADTTAPKIKLKQFTKTTKDGKPVIGTLSFLISDNLSGIDKYAVYINGKWILAEYDSKAALLNCVPESDPLPDSLNVLIQVTDRVGNKAELKLDL